MPLSSVEGFVRVNLRDLKESLEQTSPRALCNGILGEPVAGCQA